MPPGGNRCADRRARRCRWLARLARFYLDHDVSRQTAEALRHLGHDVVTVRELERERAPDERHLFSAHEQDRILVSHNEADFVLLHGAWLMLSVAWKIDRPHRGILIIPQWSPARSQWDAVRVAHEISRFVQSRPVLRNEMYVLRGSAWTVVQRPVT